MLKYLVFVLNFIFFVSIQPFGSFDKYLTQFTGVFLLVCGFMAMHMSQQFGELAEKVDALQLVFSG